MTSARALELQRRLAWTFTAELTTFERKRYVNLSDEANKAMNLNAYIGLMGGAYAFDETASGTVLRTVADPAAADLVVPASDYLLTLDADSVLLRDYCLRLVYFLEQPENARVAVTQTPYSSFRGAATRIERLAGATTDIQHILHQGMSRYDATFWVGANAVIRTQALRDIEEVETVGGFEVKRYVQDRTVIEDTESSVDLGMHGWTLVNYPERLSYSATPRTSGRSSSSAAAGRTGAPHPAEVRPAGPRAPGPWRTGRSRRDGAPRQLHGVDHLGVVRPRLPARVPVRLALLSPMVLLAALPYFWLLSSDLEYCGYKRTDVFRIYGFNLILTPVNVAGVLKSIQQALTAKKIPFARTPKVRDRTASPALYVLAPYAIVAFSVFTFVRDYGAQNWGNAVFAAFNALLATYAIVAYIGVWNSVVDLWLWATRWMYYDPRRARTVAPPAVLLEPTVGTDVVVAASDPSRSRSPRTGTRSCTSATAAATCPSATTPTSSVRPTSARSRPPPRPARPAPPGTERSLMSTTRRLSPVRVTIAVVVAAAVAVAGYAGFDRWHAAQATEREPAWFAAYTDVTATPAFAFEDVKSAKGRNVMLSFVVADHDDACSPTWGSYYSLQGAADQLDLDRRVAACSSSTARSGVSFGGLANDELATTCTKASDLLGAYRKVVDRYDLSTVDYDVEGDDLTNRAAGERRAKAVAALQDERRQPATPSRCGSPCRQHPRA